MKPFYNQANETLQSYSLKNRSLIASFSCFALLIFFLCFSRATFAQTAPPIQWQKSLGGSNSDGAASIQQTTDGGFIVAGTSESNDGDVSGNHGGYYGPHDYWVVKLDENGNIVWQKCLGGSGDDDAFSIQQTTDGGFIVAGYTGSNNDGNVSGNHGDLDYWVVKLDANGNIVWQKCLGGSGVDWALSIQETSDGGFIVAGSSDSNDGEVSGHHGVSGILGHTDDWVVKLDANGNLIWQKSLGGYFDESASSIQQTTDGGFIVAGSSSSNDGDVSDHHDSTKINQDYWIVKLDANGNIIWQKCLGGSDDDLAYSIQQTSDGGFIVAGSSFSNDGDVSGNHGGYDYWVVKLDANGNIVWQKSLGGSSDDLAYSVHQTTDGGFIVAGQSNSNDGDVSGNHGIGDDYWIVKLDANGNLVWQKCFGGSGGDDGAASIQQTTDGGFIIAGSSNSNDGNVSGNHGDYDYWIVKLGSDITTDVLQLDGQKQLVLQLYPNPSSGSFNINLQTGETISRPASIQIINIVGQTIYIKEAMIDNGVLQKEIQLNDAAPGMYLVKVTSSDHVYTSQINLEK